MTINSQPTEVPPQPARDVYINMAAPDRLPAGGVQLLKLVTRFEYALKEIGFGVDNPMRDVVEVNWDRFANEGLGAAFYHRIKEQALAPTLMHEPPKHQVLRGREGRTHLAWRSASPPTEVQGFLGAVRRVRNNLVHGGKSGDPDGRRSAALISEAIIVLVEALKEHEQLRYAFNGDY